MENKNSSKVVCSKCGSDEVMCGEPSYNEEGKLTVTCVCLNCGNTWEVEVEVEDK